MTGWTQFTARFEEERHADAIIEDVEASLNRDAYAKSIGPIARARLLGYNVREHVIEILETAGPMEIALVSVANDTSDSATIYAFWKPEPHSSNLLQKHIYESQDYSREDFGVSLGGIRETGMRAGNDFELEEMYSDHL